MKSAASGCVRECSKAQLKDIGPASIENGYNLYVRGNGGAKPRHAALPATELHCVEANAAELAQPSDCPSIQQI